MDMHYLATSGPSEEDSRTKIWTRVRPTWETVELSIVEHEKPWIFVEGCWKRAKYVGLSIRVDHIRVWLQMVWDGDAYVVDLPDAFDFPFCRQAETSLVRDLLKNPSFLFRVETLADRFAG
jgi:hypothetical protein